MAAKILTAPPINVENAPELPGLTFRSFRGETDYPTMAAIINATNQADNIEDISTVESVARSIQMFIDLGMEETALGVDTENPNGALKLYQNVGYVEDKRHITFRKPLK